MRTLRSMFVLLVALYASGCERARAPDATESAALTTTIQQLEERLRQGMVASDTAALASLWAPEYVSTSAVGHTSNRTESLMAYGTGLVNVDTAIVRDLDVRMYRTTGVSLGLLDWSGTAAGRPFRGTVRFQHVWALTDGSWRLVASQLTSQPVPDATRPLGGPTPVR
jgi:hypothetical protein